MIGRSLLFALATAALVACGASGCGESQAPASSSNERQRTPGAGTRADGVVLITIDTLRADRLGAYGWRAARTPAIDALAARGVRAERAYATAPITLTSHASLLTGLYPPHHGGRHNGMRIRANVPTLAEMLRGREFATAAFVAAFPLDRRFGLERGFDVYSDALPRGPDGRPRNERPGREVVDEAIGWLTKHAIADVSSASPTAAGAASASSAASSASAPVASVAPPGAGAAGRRPFFVWVHLFEPHAPYDADPAALGSSASASTRSVSDRYDDEVARADAQVARLVSALQPRAASTLFIVAGDHGEAFGEHGERGHSVFVYDTTLRVPLVIAGPGVDANAPRPRAGASAAETDIRRAAVAGAAPADASASANTSTSSAAGVITEPVSLVDVVPTILELLGHPAAESDGVSFAAALSASRAPSHASSRAPSPGPRASSGAAATAGATPDTGADSAVGRRAIYAESFAPLLDFGWSPLRAVREGGHKYIAAPKAELYDLSRDPEEARNLLANRADPAATIDAAVHSQGVAKTLAAQVDRFSPAELPLTPSDAPDPEALARLRSLGYLAASSGVAATRGAARNLTRPDPKDRVELAARIADITSGELQGPALRAALERIVRDDPRNGQMQMRLGFVLLEAGACREAAPRFEAAIAADVPSAEPHLGLAECFTVMGRRDAARRALAAADRIEPGNPIVAANLGLKALEDNRVAEAIRHLRAALTRTPDLHQARFALARAYGRAGQRADAAREARELLARLPSDAPQRAEVERLLAAVQ